MRGLRIQCMCLSTPFQLTLSTTSPTSSPNPSPGYSNPSSRTLHPFSVGSTPGWCLISHLPQGEGCFSLLSRRKGVSTAELQSPPPTKTRSTISHIYHHFISPFRVCVTIVRIRPQSCIARSWESSRSTRQSLIDCGQNVRDVKAPQPKTSSAPSTSIKFIRSLTLPYYLVEIVPSSTGGRRFRRIWRFHLFFDG